MASKRHLEPLDPVIFNKLPRLEMGPAAGFPASLCKSSPLPNSGSENHFNYKGSYFACPLQSPDGPEQPLARWSPAPAYLHYGPGASSQPMPVEGLLGTCLLYPPQSLSTGLQPLGTEKGKDSLVQELLMAREKWTSSPPAPGHPFPVKKPVVVNKSATLAIPKPVYRAPACFVDPRMALLLGPRPESVQQRPGDGDWALPATTPASHPLHPGEPRGGTGLQKRGSHSDPSLLPLHPSLALPAKEKVGSPIAFSPYYSTFEKYRDPPGTPFLEASCPATHSQKKGPEVSRLSPDPWAKLQAPPASPAYRERPPACYPHTHYPLPLQKAALLYPPTAPPVEPQPGTYKGFGFTSSREPFPGAYLKPQAPQSYFPSPLDAYVPRAAGVVASPPAKPAALPRDAEPPWRAGYLPSPGFALSPGDVPVLSVSLTGTEPGCEPRRAESPRQRAAGRHTSAFQPVCTPEKVPAGSGRVASEGGGGCVKPRLGEQEPPGPGGRRASPAPQETLHRGPPAPIIVGKGDASKVKDAAKELVPSSLAISPPKGLKDPGDGEVSPSSPPMPVINNVFSLAPYRDYLEGTEGSGQVPLPKEHLWGDTPPRNTRGSREHPAPGDILAMSGWLPADTGSNKVQSQEESGHRRAPEKVTIAPQDVGSQEGSPGGAGSRESATQGVVLDLSLKKRPRKSGESQGAASRARGAPEQEDAEEEREGPEEEREGPEGKAGEAEGAEPQTPPLLLEVKSNFQSSATFMFKKFKIRRSLPPGAVPPAQAGAPQPSPSALPGAPPAPQQPLLPEAPCTPGEESAEAPAPPSSAEQYFTTLHTSLCRLIAGSVSRSSPELLREWLKKAEPVGQLSEMPKSPPKPKNGTRIPEPQKATKGKEIWLAFQDVATLLTNLLSQLETFMFARKCPFPHVVRAGAIFIPIHVVKEKLFPKLPGASVDQVLQEHKVELRPTTLSEERHLRDLELKSCTSRMLKLLALKQLPDIYPDLLNLFWHDSIKQQLGSSSWAGQHHSK
ncbi:uncharacterized protein C15orf39 homolog [Aegotheles albertisi]